MPEINQNTSIKITPEKFLNACSAIELQEIDLLIQSPRFQGKIRGLGGVISVNSKELAGKLIKNGSLKMPNDDQR